MISLHLQGQQLIAGVVTDESGESLIGASILVKGTSTGAVTDTTGYFTIEVPAGKDTLEVQYIGYVTQVVVLSDGWDGQVLLEEDCIICFLDAQEITVSAIGGINGLPFGGQINFSPPAFLPRATIKTDVRYQAAGDGQQFLQTELQIEHFQYNCNSVWDGKLGYRLYDINDQFNREYYAEASRRSVRRVLLGNNYTILAGWSVLNSLSDDEEVVRHETGPRIGFSTHIGRPISLSIKGTATFYPGEDTYYARLSSGYRRFDLWIDYRQLNDFRVCSVGLDYRFTYYLQKRPWK